MWRSLSLSSLLSRAGGRSPRRPRRPLQLEALESRELLAASVYTVTTNTDTVAGTGSGVGLSGDLRYAVFQASQTANAGSTIHFAASLAGSTIRLTKGELPIQQSTVIAWDPAQGGSPVIDGTNSSRVFEVTSNVTVSISNLTIQNGDGQPATGTGPGNQGGDLLNGGNLTLTNDVIVRGSVNGSSLSLSNQAGDGGGIYNSNGAVLTLVGTTVGGGGGYGNTATGSAFSGPGQGGGIYNVATGTVVLRAGSQVIGNAAVGGVFLGDAMGGGIYNAGSLGIDGSAGTIAISGNTATGGNGAFSVGGSAFGGGVYNTGTIAVLNQASFTANIVQGGAGASGGNGARGMDFSGIPMPINDGSPGGDAGAGGDAEGGGVYNAGNPLTVLRSIFTSNTVQGGAGGAGGTGGAGGNNSANPGVGGAGGDGGRGGRGGLAAGGGVDSVGGAVTVSGSTFNSDTVKSGRGGDGGTGGAGGKGNPNGPAGNGGSTTDLTTPLGADITAGDTVLQVGGFGAGVNNLGVIPNLTVLTIGAEELLVTGFDTAANTLTVVRGFNGTTPAAQVAGSTVTLTLNSAEAAAAIGGGIAVTGANLAVANTLFSADTATGGTGGTGGPAGGPGGFGSNGGIGGLAFGGAVGTTGVGATMVFGAAGAGDVFNSNLAVGGNGGLGAAVGDNGPGEGGNGGSADGGAVSTNNYTPSSVGVTSGNFIANQANGGAAGLLNKGGIFFFPFTVAGSATGGAVSLQSNVAGSTAAFDDTVLGSTGSGNTATGGSAAFGDSGAAFGGGLASTDFNVTLASSNPAAPIGQVVGNAATGGSANYSAGSARGAGTYTSGGSLTLSSVSITGNVATGGSGTLAFLGLSFGGDALGGGSAVLNGSAVVSNSHLDGNTLQGGAGGPGRQGDVNFGNQPNGGPAANAGNALGGGLYLFNRSATPLTFSFLSSTASSNNVTGGIGGIGGGAGIFGTAHIQGGAGGNGGDASGGGVYVTSDSASSFAANVGSSSFLADRVTAGDGGSGGAGEDGTGGNGGNAQGGGLYFAGQNPNAASTLTVTASTFANYRVASGNGGNAGQGTTQNGGNGGAGGNGGNAQGGGLYDSDVGALTASGASSTLTVTNSTFDGLGSAGSLVLTAADGGNGGIAGLAATALTSATGGAGGNAGNAVGGGIFVNAGEATLVNDTIVNNTATLTGNTGTGGSGGTGAGDPTTGTSGAHGLAGAGAGGGFFAAAGTANSTASIGNTILDLNAATTVGTEDAGGIYTSLGSNVVGANAGGFTAGGDQVGVTAAGLNLGGLANNGGPTLTDAPGAGSAAVDLGDNTLAQANGVTTDQRGFARPANNVVDIGAYEVQSQPGVSGLSPVSTPQGVAVTLTITGANFLPGVTVNFGGTTLGPSSATATSLTVTVPASLVAVAGTVTVFVQNPGGISSAPFTFAVLDVTAPSSTITFPTGRSVNSGTFPGAFTGTFADNPGGSGVVQVLVSVFNGTNYFDGTGFNSPAVVRLPATLGVGTWSLPFAVGNLTPGGTYTVNSQARDAAGNQEAVGPTATFTFVVAPSSIALSNNTLPDGSVPGTVVGTLTTADANPGPFTYALVNTPANPDNNFFSINGNTLVFTGTANRSAKPTFTVDIQSTDGRGQSVTMTFTLTVTATLPHTTIGAFDPSTATWYLRNENGPGAPDAGQFKFGGVGWAAVTGHFTGGATTVGVVNNTGASGLSRTTNSLWYLARQNTSNTPLLAPVFAYGLAGWTPITGDWTGTGRSGIGTFDPTTGTWYLKNGIGAGVPDFTFQFGLPNWIPVVGDFTGSGHSEIAVIDPTTETWYVRSSPSAGVPDVGVFQYGLPGWKPVAGDWSGSGQAGIAVVDPSGTWYIRYTATPGAPDISPFPYGLGSWTPVSGDYDFPALPELAAGGPLAGTSPPPLTQAGLDAAVAAALGRLRQAGVSGGVLAELGAAAYTVADLGGADLGLTDPQTHAVRISAGAAGYGWYADESAASDALFGASGVAKAGSAAAGREDLLTVVLHEMGHVVGRDDVAPGDALMSLTLPAGVRRVDALDSVFSGGL